MTAPTPYDRQTSFALYSAENPTAQQSGVSIDAEFNAVKLSIDETQQNLAQIQDDDGVLKRGSVGRAQLDASISIGFGAPAQWVTAGSYTAEVDTVFYNSKFYICTVTHVAGVAFDSTKWSQIADFTLAAVISDGSITSAKLADGAVGANKIADGSISNSKLASGAVTTSKIADLSVSFGKLASDIGPALANLILPAGLGPLPWSGSTAPDGWVFCRGQTLSRATYPALWVHAQTEIAAGNTLYNVGDGSTTFGIADVRGRVVAGFDPGNATGRMNVAPNGAVLGAVGGGQSATLVTGNLPAYTPSGGVVTNMSHNALASTGVNATLVGLGSGGVTHTWMICDGTTPTGASVTAASAFAGTAQGGASVPFSVVQPTIIANMILKAH